MNRLDRRTVLLRAKRNGCFDRDQYWQERTVRARCARKVRCLLRANQPVIMLTPRWSHAQRFLDDVAVDLAIGGPEVEARTLSLQPLSGKTLHQSWAWLVAAFTEFFKISATDSAWQAVSRVGFRTVMQEILDAAQAGPRRCLLVHGVEHVSLDALADLIQAFNEYGQRVHQRQVNLLLAGAIDGGAMKLAGAERVVLADYSDFEAVDALVEQLGPMSKQKLEGAVSVVGGVPAMLEALGAGSQEGVSEVVLQRDSLWRVVGNLADEVRGAMDIVNSSDALAERMEHLARDGAQPAEHEVDSKLWLAGLVRFFRRDGVERTVIRAPWFADLALAG